MNTTTLLCAAGLSVALASGSVWQHEPEAAERGTVEHLSAVLTGAFSSGAQAAEDPENYFDIRLHAVEIWAGRDDGPWLYVEQAAAAALERPYRQRVYQLGETEENGEPVLTSAVYTFDEPLRFAGAWKTPGRFDDELSPADLSLRDGCTIYLTWDDERAAFVGATRGEGCASALGGASYATSEVELFDDRLETWDRGFFDTGEQAWGATEGPYLFVRVED